MIRHKELITFSHEVVFIVVKLLSFFWTLIKLIECTQIHRMIHLQNQGALFPSFNLSFLSKDYNKQSRTCTSNLNWICIHIFNKGQIFHSFINLIIRALNWTIHLIKWIRTNPLLYYNMYKRSTELLLHSKSNAHMESIKWTCIVHIL